MREILFRGKRPENGEWSYGYYVHNGPVNSQMAYIIPFYASTFYGFQVYPNTVCQYTGLIDKNAVKIFEGDIVDLFGMKGKVVQECGAFGIEFMETIDYDLLESKIPFNKSANFCFNNFISLWEVFYEVEVISNVHDNPELLEK